MPKVYIELEAAIEMFEQAFDNNWEISGTLDRLRAIPAADVGEVRHGRWEWDRRVEAYRCSACQRHNADRAAYCPNCGADLREDTT